MCKPERRLSAEQTMIHILPLPQTPRSSSTTHPPSNNSHRRNNNMTKPQISTNAKVIRTIITLGLCMLSIIYHLELVVIKINMDKANTLLAKKEYYESLTSIMPLDSMIPSLRGSSASSSSSRRLNVDDEDEDEDEDEEEIELVYDEETVEWIEVEYEDDDLYEDEDDAVDIDHPSFVDVKKQATYRMLWMKDGWREPTIAHYIPPDDEDGRVDEEESTMTTKKGKKKNREEKNKNKKKEKEKSQEVVKDDNQDKKVKPKNATKKKEKKDKADSDTPTPTRTKKNVQQRSSQKTQGEIDSEKRIKEKAKGT